MDGGRAFQHYFDELTAFLVIEAISFYLKAGDGRMPKDASEDARALTAMEDRALASFRRDLRRRLVRLGPMNVADAFTIGEAAVLMSEIPAPERRRMNEAKRKAALKERDKRVEAMFEVVRKRYGTRERTYEHKPRARRTKATSHEPIDLGPGGMEEVVDRQLARQAAASVSRYPRKRQHEGGVEPGTKPAGLSDPTPPEPVWPKHGHRRFWEPPQE